MLDEITMFNKDCNSIELEKQETGSTSLSTLAETSVPTEEYCSFERQVTTASLIQEYDGIQRQLTPFQDYEQEQVQDIDGQVASAVFEINHRQSVLNQTQNADMILQNRVHRNENPRFFHYLVCNRSAKVERLKEELQQVKTTVQTLIDKLSLDSAGLSQLLRKQLEVHTNINKKLQMQGQTRQLFNQVVDCQPPTQTLKQLRAREQQKQASLASEEKLLQAIGNSVQQVQQGLSLFQKAEYHYRQTVSINERLQNLYAKVCEEAVGCDFGSDTRSFISGVAEENNLQWQHGNASSQANGLAIQAFQAIKPGFAAVPVEARSRYPQLCQSLKEDVILWHASSFVAADEDIQYDMLVCKIDADARVVKRCTSMASQQLGLMMAVQDAVAINMHQLQAGLQNLEQKIIGERNNMFDGIRSALLVAPVV